MLGKEQRIPAWTAGHHERTTLGNERHPPLEERRDRGPRPVVPGGIALIPASPFLFAHFPSPVTPETVRIPLALTPASGSVPFAVEPDREGHVHQGIQIEAFSFGRRGGDALCAQ